MKKLWSNLAEELVPYQPGEQTTNENIIKLNTNENPFPPSEHVINAIKTCNLESLSLYPDHDVTELKKELSNYHNVEKHNIFVGNGSDEILAFSWQAFWNPEDVIAFPEITYNFYKVYCDLYRVKSEMIPLTADFKINTAAILNDVKGIIFPNPNAPTGRFLPIIEIEEILKKHTNKVVIIDEAYIDFGGGSCIELINRYDNLLVIRTFSKSRSFADLRIGYAVGDHHLIQALNTIRYSFNPYSADYVGMKAAIASIQDDQTFRSNCQAIVEIRRATIQKLESLGCHVIPSMTNFILFSHPVLNGSILYEKLKHKNILVRHFDTPKIQNYLRVSIGSETQMNAFISALTELI